MVNLLVIFSNSLSYRGNAISQEIISVYEYLLELMPKHKQMPFYFRKKDDTYIYIIYMPLPNRPVVLKQHKEPFSFLSVRSDPRHVRTAAQEEPPVFAAEISSKQIWYHM